MIEELGHGEANQHRILDGPHMRWVGEKAELQRKGFHVLGDIGVHAVGVGLEMWALRRFQDCGRLLRGLPQPEDSLLAIGRDEVRSKDYSEITGGEAARHVHLPKTLLRRHVSLGEEKVVEVGSRDGRDTQRVAAHNHWLRESGQMNGAVYLRQRRLHGAIKPDIEGKERDQQDGKKDDNNAKRKSGVRGAWGRGECRSFHGNPRLYRVEVTARRHGAPATPNILAPR